MEPELGLGLVIKADHRQAVLHFPAADTQRLYATASAPLKRSTFHKGDTLILDDGSSLQIDALRNKDNGLIVYLCGDREISEAELAGVQATESPLPRLLSGHVDSPAKFNLRRKTLEHRYNWLHLPVRGFIGCRISLIPHQLDVAYETASRPRPRVLLADEVGLGKTIEAGLILHRMLLTGRMSRVLIIVPDALTVQWFIELYRRFHLSFTLVGDHPLKQELGTEDHGEDFESSLCLAGLDGLLSHPRWIEKALDAQWDMVIFDEAHHLGDTAGAYQFAEALAASAPGLLLLTATPESVGLEAHFNRLRLLDPARYTTFDHYKKQHDNFQPIANLAASLLDKDTISKEETALLSEMDIPISDNRQGMIDALVDRHGEGRAVFRNTRVHIPGFPQRHVHTCPLKADSDSSHKIADEVASDIAKTMYQPNLNEDPRIKWLIQWLKKHTGEKVLLLCRTPEKAKAIQDTLDKFVSVKSAIFHENMSLLKRDRQAAWFAEHDGARLLIASEIGGEGRNFQFSSHLIFFDIPADPEKIEQRIGRLDRIGQENTVHIYLPYLIGSGMEVASMWLHTGLNAFGANIPGGHILFAEFQAELHKIMLHPDKEQLARLISKTQIRAAALAKQIHQGRDRLLELNACRPQRAEQLDQTIKDIDSDITFRKWAGRLLDHFGIKADHHTPDIWHLDFELLNQPALPLPRDHEHGVIATFNRNLAQKQENWLFLTSEHPLIDAATTLLLQADTGNACLAHLDEPGFNNMLLEAIFIVECVAPTRLFAERFLPPTPVRIVINKNLSECTSEYPIDRMKRLKPADNMVLDNDVIREKISQMANTASQFADEAATAIRDKATEVMTLQMTTEIDRLIALARVNSGVKREEIALLITERSDLETALINARIRMDSLRLILPIK